MSELINKASDLLRHMYDPDRGLFSYSTTVVDGTYQNRFDHPKAQRYTVNTLAGLWKLAKSDPGLWNFDETLETYLRLQGDNVCDPGDQGLLLYVLSESRHPHAHSLFERVKKIVQTEGVYSAQVLQDACWQLYGTIAYARRFDNSEAQALSECCVTWLQQHFMNADTLFPYHQSHGLRRRFVSFGGITYFLKALFEYASTFHDDNVLGLFKKSVRQVLAQQGENGEWAWFHDAESGRIMDWYEVYSVHQEAMAMLFLLPAMDSGVLEARDAVNKSVKWLFGHNELQARMMFDEPFFSYRSIRRKGPFQRQARYARAVFLANTRRSAMPSPSQHTEINTECRSYEMGWTVYAWAGRNDFPDFTNLRLI